MSVPEAQALLDRLTRIRARAGAYFGQIRLALDQVEPLNRWSRPTSDSPSEKLSPDQRAEAVSIVADLHEFAGTIPPVTRQSALLEEADERDIGHAIKGMRAAIRLRRYSYWDTEVLWDEDRVLGVRRPGQDEDTPLDPKDAEAIFAAAADRLEPVISLATSSATRDPGQPRYHRGQ